MRKLSDTLWKPPRETRAAITRGYKKVAVARKKRATEEIAGLTCPRHRAELVLNNAYKSRSTTAIYAECPVCKRRYVFRY